MVWIKTEKEGRKAIRRRGKGRRVVIRKRTRQEEEEGEDEEYKGLYFAPTFSTTNVHD